jgi:hypothetical protein
LRLQGSGSHKQKADLREVLDLVKEKLDREPEAACGIFWTDSSPTTRYAVGEEDVVTTLYGVGEEG